MGERATKQRLTAKNGTETLGSSPIIKRIYSNKAEEYVKTVKQQKVNTNVK